MGKSRARLLRAMNNPSLERWLQKIESVHPEEIELGLGRVSSVARRLGLLPVSQPVVTVGGTNGKGTVVAVLEALLNEAGYSTGAFTSPHILRFNERIRVAGSEVPDAHIVEAFAAIEEARGDVTLTYFEFATLAALLIFESRRPDIVILEVGLGGRLDAVNMVDSSVSVITSIDLDHQKWLGQTRGEIAREKSGIMRRAVPVVIGELDPPPELAAAVAKTGASPAFYIGKDYSVTAANDACWTILRDAGGISRQFALRMSGSLLPENVATALQAALLLGVKFSDECLDRALRRMTLPGRRETRQVGGRIYVLDVAHNPAAVRKMLEYLDEKPCNGRTVAVFSIMADKDVQAIIEAVSGYFDAWFLADQPGNQRAARAADLASLLNASGQAMISVSKNLRQALRRAQAVTGQGDRLVVFGSFYTVAGVSPLLDPQQGKTGRYR